MELIRIDKIDYMEQNEGIPRPIDTQQWEPRGLELAHFKITGHLNGEEFVAILIHFSRMINFGITLVSPPGCLWKFLKSYSSLRPPGEWAQHFPKGLMKMAFHVVEVELNPYVPSIFNRDNVLLIPGCCAFVDGTFHEFFRPGADG